MNKQLELNILNYLNDSSNATPIASINSKYKTTTKMLLPFIVKNSKEKILTCQNEQLTLTNLGRNKILEQTLKNNFLALKKHQYLNRIYNKK